MGAILQLMPQRGGGGGPRRVALDAALQALSLFLVASAQQGFWMVIGKNVAARSLTCDRVQELHSAQRSEWLDYLERCIRIGFAQRAFAMHVVVAKLNQ
jgi:hypothetical protein